MNLRVRLAEVLDHILLELIVIPIADADEVESNLGKLLGQVRPVSHARAEHNRLDWLTKYLIGLLNPCRNDIARDLDASVSTLLL